MAAVAGRLAGAGERWGGGETVVQSTGDAVAAAQVAGHSDLSSITRYAVSVVGHHAPRRRSSREDRMKYHEINRFGLTELSACRNLTPRYVVA